MKHFLHSVLAFFCVCSASFSQEGKVLRPATDQEFVGYWRILLIPDEKSNLKIKNKETGFSDPCQILVHKPEGAWVNITISNQAGEDESRKRCLALTQKDVDLSLALNRATDRFRWGRITPQLFAVEDTTNKARRYWAVDYATRDVSLPDYFDFKKGDLLMNMTIPTNDGRAVLAWRMVLRPIPVSLNSDAQPTQ